MLFHRVSYRWLVVAAASVGMAGGYGGITTIAVLIAPLEGEFGWLRADISLAYLFLTIGAAFGGLVAGRLSDRLPTGPIAAVGALIIGSGLMLVSIQTRIEVIQVIYLTIGFLGFACLYAPLLTTVSLWFDRQAGIAMGIVTAGGALGQAIVPPLFQALTAGFGWRMACVVFGAGFVVTVGPTVLLLRKPSATRAAGTQGPQGWPVPPALSIGLLSAAALFCCVLMGVPSVHLVAFATGAGLEPATGAGLVTVVMLAGAVGRLVTGGIVDRFGPLAAYAALSMVQTGAVGLFGPAAQQGPALVIVAAIYGFGFGGVMTALVCAVRAAVPAGSVGSAMALVGLLAWLGMGAGGYQAGLCFDRTGSYDLPFLMAALAGCANLGALGLLGLLIRRARAQTPALAA